MAKLHQTSCSIADFRKATFSLWFRIPSEYEAQFEPGGNFRYQSPANRGGPPGTTTTWYEGVELITFGQDPNSTDEYSSINICKGDAAAAETTDTFSGGHHSIGGNTSSWAASAWFNSERDPSSLSEDDTFVTQYEGGGEALHWSSGERVYGHLAYLPTAFTFDRGHHLLVAADLDAADTFGGFPETNNAGNHIYEAVTSVTARNRKIEIYFDGLRVTGLYVAGANWTASSPLITNWATPAVSPAHDAIINGFPISMPTWVEALRNPFPRTFGPVTYNPRIIYGTVQTWFGQYIDPAVHLDKFVIEAGGVGRPANPQLAVEQFGEPHLYFDGGAGRFKNRGTGDEFIEVGTLADFTPRLSYVVP